MAWFSLVDCTLVPFFQTWLGPILNRVDPGGNFGLFLEVWLVWSIPYGLDPVVSYSPGSDLVQFLHTGPCVCWFVSERFA